MSRILLLASAAVAIAATWHAMQRFDMPSVRAFVGSDEPSATLQTAQREGAARTFLRQHPGMAAGSPHRQTPADGETCPFSGKHGRSSLSLEDALELHGQSTTNVPRRSVEPIWL